MGKKRVIKQSAEEIIKEKEQQEAAVAKKKKEIKGRKLTQGRAYIKSSYNNTIITITDQNGDVIAQESAGSVGFKGPKKATPFAAARAVSILVEKLAKTGIRGVVVFVKGVGPGKESAIRALATNGLDILSIKDITPIPHNGCRPPKPRRV